MVSRPARGFSAIRARQAVSVRSRSRVVPESTPTAARRSQRARKLGAALAVLHATLAHDGGLDPLAAAAFRRKLGRLLQRLARSIPRASVRSMARRAEGRFEWWLANCAG